MTRLRTALAEARTAGTPKFVIGPVSDDRLGSEPDPRNIGRECTCGHPTQDLAFGTKAGSRHGARTNCKQQLDEPWPGSAGRRGPGHSGGQQRRIALDRALNDLNARLGERIDSMPAHRCRGN